MNIQTNRAELVGAFETGSVQNSDQPMYLNIEQADGILQLVPITEQQLKNIGMLEYDQSAEFFSIENDQVLEKGNVLMAKPLGSCENPIEIIKDGEMLHSTQNLSQDHLQEIAQALQFETINLKGESTVPEFVYQVVYPEELQLKPATAKRGRPRKRPITEEELVNAVNTEPKRPQKSARTRSGRITRPPQYIEKDFKKIDISEGDHAIEIKTLDFEPLKTNVDESSSNSVTTTNSLTNHQRKRSIAPQYRCPTCNKAYLGCSKMIQHLEKYPDHGPIPEYCKKPYNDTWNYLIDLCNKNPVGRKGTKFCKELISLFENLRLLAKVFFKNPTNSDKNLYFVDDFFASFLGINSGHYILKENELHKNVELSASLNEKASVKSDQKNVNTPLITKKKEKVEKTFFVEQKTDNILKENKPNDIQSFENSGYNLSPEKSFVATDVLNDFSDKTVNEKPKDLPFSQTNLLHSDLLSDNLLLTSLPSLRDELILNNVDTGQVTSLLDNSTGSDEVMNVDQFVNERFKNITESDIDLPNSSLNLDLQALDLFQFHTS